MNAKVAAAISFTFLASAAWADCDAEAGRKVFNKCSACHTLEPGVHLMGPSLHGVFGRQAGTADGFSYSAAMAEAGFAWDDGTMSAFLENPMQYLPGTTMPFAGLRKVAQRQALNCYLKESAAGQ
jgi:cytochrome c